MLRALYDRFMLDDTPHRLGNLSSSLARIADFIEVQRPTASIMGVLTEAGQFAEWSQQNLDDQRRAELKQLGYELLLWQMQWEVPQSDPVQVAQVAHEAQKWSERILEISGLLSPHP